MMHGEAIPRSNDDKSIPGKIGDLLIIGTKNYNYSIRILFLKKYSSGTGDMPQWVKCLHTSADLGSDSPVSTCVYKPSAGEMQIKDPSNFLGRRLAVNMGSVSDLVSQDKVESRTVVDHTTTNNFTSF